MSLSFDVLAALQAERLRLNKIVDAVNVAIAAIEKLIDLPGNPTQRPPLQTLPAGRTKTPAAAKKAPPIGRTKTGKKRKEKKPSKTGRGQGEKTPCPECGEPYYPAGMAVHRARHKREGARAAADADAGGEELNPGSAQPDVVPVEDSPGGPQHKGKREPKLPDPVEIAETTCPHCQLRTVFNPCSHCHCRIAPHMIGELQP